MNDIEKLISFFQNEWAVIAQAPATFLVAVLLLSVIIWRLVRREYLISLTNAQSEVQLYKARLDGASPDEASRRISELETRLADLADPWLLSELQLKEMSVALNGVKGSLVIARDVGSVETAKVQSQLRRFFADQGWHVETVAALGLKDPPASGLTVIDRGAAENEKTALLAALVSAGLEFQVRTAPRVAEEGVQRRSLLQLHLSDSTN